MTTQRSKPYKILLVEDETSYRALLQAVLRKKEFHCVACINGDQAVEKLNREQFDLLILDYLLPGPSALEVLRWARNKNIQTYAMIITAYPSDQLRTECESLGHTRLIVKPDLEFTKFPAVVLETLKKHA
jgi:DNA-binding response OmpR family regulator